MYLWNATSGDIQQLLEMENPEEYVTSVSWIKDGQILAVGTSNSDVQVCMELSLRSENPHTVP